MAMIIFICQKISPTQPSPKGRTFLLSQNMKKITYESALSELQIIAQTLQNETVSLDELNDKSRRAAELLAFCKEKLRTVEAEVATNFQLNL
jgi:exodeoxyribonuclease VII small subunit